MLSRFKFIILLGLCAAGCMTAGESSSCKEVEPVVVHDTVSVQIVKKDTIRLRDTITITKWDTVEVHDTTKVTLLDTVLASLPDPENLFGVWTGQASGKTVTVAFSSSQSVIHAAEFTGNIGSASVEGYIGQVDSAQAKITWGGFHPVTWIMNLEKGTLKIQEIGDMMFPGGSITLRKR